MKYIQMDDTPSFRFLELVQKIHGFEYSTIALTSAEQCALFRDFSRIPSIIETGTMYPDKFSCEKKIGDVTYSLNGIHHLKKLK